MEFQQWHRDIGQPLEYFADVYAKDGWVELYTRPRNGRHLSERFAGIITTELDIARLLWQCQFISDGEWAEEQKNSRKERNSWRTFMPHKKPLKK